MLDDKDYSDLIDEEYAYPHPLHFLWSHLCFLVKQPKYAHFSSFENRSDLFLSVLKRLLDNKKVVIGKERKIISNNTDYIIEMFKKVFPKDDNEMEDGIWFLSYNMENHCPGGAVWIVDEVIVHPDYCTPTPDGKYYYWS